MKRLLLPGFFVFFASMLILGGLIGSLSGCASGGDPVRRALEKTAIGVKEAKNVWAGIREIELPALQEQTLDECMEKELTQGECKDLYFERIKVYYAIAESLDMAHYLLESIERGYDAVQAGRSSDYDKMLREIGECLWHIEFIMRKFREIDQRIPDALESVREYLNLLQRRL